ncbi:Signal transduction histidine kinase [Paenibacillus tianmuensis]|uniref:histidine kinase n=1 Tax=Paenibacillus tianmuensis TaxID=624147 RepID=A0A1G4PNP3_9BACL|nr:HAMP domain-containing sensor histidine kinase [Paenibacillus tianmuensis]SCW33954.1 Signal transduction histidine kinase [Paenibacillus tianmuensis]
MKHDKGAFLLIVQFIVLSALFILDWNYQPQGIVRGALFAGLFAVTVIHLFVRYRFMARLKAMVAALRRTTQGNTNTRLLANDDRHLDEAIFSINELIEQLAKVHVRTIRSEAARKSLLSNISHDIRTPLTSIIGYADALKDDIAASTEEKERYLDILSGKAVALKELIDEIFELAKLDADEILLKPETLDFAEIVRESVIGFLPELKKYAIELKVNIPEEACFIEADRVSLLRIVSNLIKNAVEHGKDGKVLGIELMEATGKYRLLVWDRGSGISPDDLPRVFERMYRTDRARNPSAQGSGLGLAIAKVLAEKHSGTLWAESEPGVKTTFGFSIPKRGAASRD